jgi:hypothetical protein
MCSQGIHYVESRGEKKPCLRVTDAALIRQATILKMKEPDVFDLHHIQKFMASGDMSLLLGPDQNIWGSIGEPESCRGELAVICGRRDKDTFSHHIAAVGAGLCGPDKSTWGSISELYPYSEDGLISLRPWMCTDGFSANLSGHLMMFLHFWKRLCQGKKNVGPMKLHASFDYSHQFVLSGELYRNNIAGRLHCCVGEHYIDCTSPCRYCSVQ